MNLRDIEFQEDYRSGYDDIADDGRIDGSRKLRLSKGTESEDVILDMVR